MRPHYETQADLDSEQKIADYLADFWSCRFIKLPAQKYKVDYLMERDEKYTWCEIKRAHINFGDYPFMISYKKIEAARLLALTSRCKFILVFKCKDVLCYHEWDFDAEYKFEYSGRTLTTRDVMAVEPVFRIDSENCKIIERFATV